MSPDGRGEGIDTLLGFVEKVLTPFELMLRMGIPMSVELKKERRGYSLVFKEALGQPVEDQEPIPMKRVGRRSLAVDTPERRKKPLILKLTRKDEINEAGRAPEPCGGYTGTPEKPLILKLTRKDEINQTFKSTVNDPDLGTLFYEMNINFKRY